MCNRAELGEPWGISILACTYHSSFQFVSLSQKAEGLYSCNIWRARSTCYQYTAIQTKQRLSESLAECIAELRALLALLLPNSLHSTARVKTFKTVCCSRTPSRTGNYWTILHKTALHVWVVKMQCCFPLQNSDYWLYLGTIPTFAPNLCLQIPLNKSPFSPVPRLLFMYALCRYSSQSDSNHTGANNSPTNQRHVI